LKGFIDMNRPLRVLLVEDSEEDAELLVYELERSGYDPIYQRVDTAMAMNAALDRKSWDIVIADYTLPNFSAPAALTLLKERELDLPFIIVSGTIGEDIAVAAMKAGAHDYLMKGKLARLAPAVERELREAGERRKRREAEQTVRQNEERFRALIENALDIITVVSTDGIIHYESPSVEKVLGYKPEDLVNKNIFDYIHSEDITNLLKMLNQVTHNQFLTLSLEFRFQHRDGSWRILEAVGKHFIDRDHTSRLPMSNTTGFKNNVFPLKLSSIVLNSRDITERKRSEEICHALERERELSEARFRFVSMMSHEFRNPLTRIRVSSELLKNFFNKTTEGQKERCLNNLELAAQEMTQLLDDILTITRADVGNLELNLQVFDLAGFCYNLVEQMQITAGNKHTLNFVSRGTCNQACLDENLIKHILTNLISNAIKYSPECGDIWFELSCQNGEAIFRIQDQGIGISLDDRQRLFEAFHRGRNVGKIPGTGLGLSIVKRFVDLHGGIITVQSELGVGTTFTVTLPMQSHSAIEKQCNMREYHAI
jgi:PAS domain S-box-containing protein